MCFIYGEPYDPQKDPEFWKKKVPRVHISSRVGFLGKFASEL